MEARGSCREVVRGVEEEGGMREVWVGVRSTVLWNAVPESKT
jgi:hypothetical protein